MSSKGTLEVILTEMAKAIRPLAEAAEVQPRPDGLLLLAKEAGIDFNAILVSPESLNGISNSISSAFSVLKPIVERGEAPDGSDIVPLLSALGDIFVAIEQINNLQLRADAGAGFQKIGKRLFDYLVIRYLSENHEGIYHALLLIGAIVPADEENKFAEIDLKYIPDLISDPGGMPAAVYKWGSRDFKARILLQRLNDLLLDLNIPCLLVFADDKAELAMGLDPDREDPEVQLRIPLLLYKKDGVGSLAGLTIFPLVSGPPEDKGVFIAPYGAGTVSQTIPLSDMWACKIQAAADVVAPYGFAVRPSVTRPFNLAGGAPPASISVSAAIERENPSGEKFVLFGDPKGTRLEAGTVGLRVGFNYKSSKEFFAELPLVGGKITVAPGSDDGFLAKILPADGFSAPVDFTLGWTSSRGFYFGGSAGLSIVIPSNMEIGPLKIKDFGLELKTAEDKKLALVITGSVSAEIGPVIADVESMGLKADIDFDSEMNGNLGLLDLKAKFEPPKGVALGMDTGAVVGGGYLFIDSDNGRYAGVMQLEMFKIGVKAIALISTRMPDGTSGFSMLVSISAEFQPIQLSFGFTLNGVGGLIGIHRSMNLDALQAGIKNRSLDAILFPDDPLKDAPRLISLLGSAFPCEEDRFVFGPMAIIGWGTPPIITAQLGIILEIPSPVRLAVLGQLGLGLPSLEVPAPLIIMHMDVLGALDFDKKKFGIDATLYDSRVVYFTLSGDMVLRTCWGDEPSFALSVGGMNPRFTPPPGFPVLERLQISIGAGNNPRISLQGYFALTSNSAQVGAKLEVYAKKAGFSVYGFLGFDALFIFKPFSFVVDIGAGVALKRGSSTLMTVHLSFTLSGPTPWHAKGHASFKILFVRISVGFDATFGNSAQVSLPDVNPWPELKKALNDPRNWLSELPSGSGMLVTFRKLDAEDPKYLAHPFSTISFKQKVLPFDHELTRFGNGSPSPSVKYTVGKISVAGSDLEAEGITVLEDSFAPAQFEAMSDAEKLSRKSFEKMPAGVQFMFSGRKLPDAVELNVLYETQFIDGADRPVLELFKLGGPLMASMLASSSSARSRRKHSGMDKFGRAEAPLIKLRDRKYAVAGTLDLKMHGEIMGAQNETGLTQAQAYSRLKAYCRNNPAWNGKLQVVPIDEAIK